MAASLWGRYKLTQGRQRRKKNAPLQQRGVGYYRSGCSRSQQSVVQTLATKAAHQPFGLTALPGKIEHGRSASPSLPWTRLHLAHT